MAIYIDLICRDCGENVEVYCDGDNEMHCPECRGNNLKEVDDDDSFMDD